MDAIRLERTKIAPNVLMSADFQPRTGAMPGGFSSIVESSLTTASPSDCSTFFSILFLEVLVVNFCMIYCYSEIVLLKNFHIGDSVISLRAWKDKRYCPLNR